MTTKLLRTIRTDLRAKNMGYNDPVHSKKEIPMAYVWLAVKTIVALTVFATLLLVLAVTGILNAIF